MSTQKTDVETPPRSSDNKMIFGAQEIVYIKEAGVNFASRIDTGAHYSSLSAINIKRFVRDSKKFVRFDVVANGTTMTLEAPYVKSDTIRQAQSDKPQLRPIVRLTVKIGDRFIKSDFTLSDRRRMQYALLIGRTLLTDLAIVDVSRINVQGIAMESKPVIVPRDVFMKSGQKFLKNRAPNPEEEKVEIAYPVGQNEEHSGETTKP